MKMSVRLSSGELINWGLSCTMIINTEKERFIFKLFPGEVVSCWLFVVVKFHIFFDVAEND